MNQPAKHMGIRRIQDIFRQNDQRLFHWADSREVPADNNLAERDLRPSVIARKVSFGSVTDAGAHVRSTLTTVVTTLKKRGEDVRANKTRPDVRPRNQEADVSHSCFSNQIPPDAMPTHRHTHP